MFVDARRLGATSRGIASLEALEQAARQDRLKNVRGLGAALQSKIHAKIVEANLPCQLDRSGAKFPGHHRAWSVPSAEMSTLMAQEESKGNRNFSDFGPSANLLAELEAVFRSYHESGIGKTRHYVHDDEAALYGCAPGTFTDWEALPENSDLLFYEGLHGAVKADRVNISQYPDLKIGVVPVINLECQGL
jgi:phosphoribulokinase